MADGTLLCVEDFHPGDLVWFVAVEPGEQPQPVVVLVGDGAQALVDSGPDLFRILTEIGMPERSFQVHSRHAEVLLLHTPEEPAQSVAYHYGIARELVADLWERETATPACDRSIDPRVRDRSGASSSGARACRQCRDGYERAPANCFPSAFR
jgi:hypothetical protein